MGHARSLFLYFRPFYNQLTVSMFNKNADYWIRTRVLWYWKRPRCQLCHNHCPILCNCLMDKNDRKLPKLLCYLLFWAQSYIRQTMKCCKLDSIELTFSKYTKCVQIICKFLQTSASCCECGCGSVCFWYQRSVVRIQSSAKLYC